MESRTHDYYIASVSCGNDSYCMADLIIENDLPLDEIVFYDTGMEFNCIYRLWDILCQKAERKGIKCTTLRQEVPFLTKMFDIEVRNRDGSGSHKGYSWCGGRCRWGTTDKQKALDKYAESKNAWVYVGIAADELNRKPDKPYKLHPLKDFGYTQSDCLAYNRERGVRWEENGIDLYDILDRVSCWCCANKNRKELKNIYLNLPEYWEKLKDLQSKTDRPMKKFRNKKHGEYGNVFDMEKVFEEETAESWNRRAGEEDKHE